MDLDCIFCAFFRKGAIGKRDFLEDSNENSKNTNYDSCKSNWSLNDAVLHICDHFQVTKKDLTSQSKSKHIVDARSVLAFITRQAKKWPLEDLAVLLNKNSGTISRLATRAEQQPELLAIIDRNNFIPK